jgi:hypothetical protein
MNDSKRPRATPRQDDKHKEKELLRQRLTRLILQNEARRRIKPK